MGAEPEEGREKGNVSCLGGRRGLQAKEVGGQDEGGLGVPGWRRVQHTQGRGGTHTSLCMFCGSDMRHRAVRGWWIGLLGLQGIGRWTGLRERGHEALVGGAVRNSALIGLGVGLCLQAYSGLVGNQNGREICESPERKSKMAGAFQGRCLSLSSHPGLFFVGI